MHPKTFFFFFLDRLPPCPDICYLLRSKTTEEPGDRPISSPAHHQDSLQQATLVRLRARLSCLLMQHPNRRRSSCPSCLNTHIWRRAGGQPSRSTRIRTVLSRPQVILTDAGKRSLSARSCRPSSLALVMARQASHLMFESTGPFSQSGVTRGAANNLSVIQSPPLSVLGRLHPRARRLPSSAYTMREEGRRVRPQSSQGQRTTHPVCHEATPGVCLCRARAPIPRSAMVMVRTRTGRQRSQCVGARLPRTAVSGQMTARHRRRSDPTTQVLVGRYSVFPDHPRDLVSVVV